MFSLTTLLLPASVVEPCFCFRIKIEYLSGKRMNFLWLLSYPGLIDGLQSGLNSHDILSIMSDQKATEGVSSDIGFCERWCLWVDEHMFKDLWWSTGGARVLATATRTSQRRQHGFVVWDALQAMLLLTLHHPDLEPLRPRYPTLFVFYFVYLIDPGLGQTYMDFVPCIF